MEYEEFKETINFMKEHGAWDDEVISLAEIFLNAIEKAIEIKKKEIIAMVGNDIGVLDRAVSRVEDKVNNVQNNVYDLSYSIKQLQS